MKTAKKKKLVKALGFVTELLQKCGGEGGTPGPCPTGKKPARGKKPALDYKDLLGEHNVHELPDGSRQWKSSGEGRMDAYHPQTEALDKRRSKLEAAGFVADYPKGYVKSGYAEGGGSLVTTTWNFTHPKGHTAKAVKEIRHNGWTTSNEKIQVSVTVKEAEKKSRKPKVSE